MKKIVTIIGARPQFIKAAVVSKAFRNPHLLETQDVSEFIVHTGQHYDHNMSRIFFEEMEIPEPHVNLGIGSGSHGKQTGQMLIGIEEVLNAEKPDYVLVYGDTNSTVAGALAAAKLHTPVAHVEAGLRSYNRDMPEEHNRVLTDHCADLLFCPSQTAVDNLRKENIVRGVHFVGDVMYDSLLQFGAIAHKRSTILQRLYLKPKAYLLATIHRPYNTDSPDALREILSAFLSLGEPVVFPVHPRTGKIIQELEIEPNMLSASSIIMIPPVGYFDMLVLEENARMILTDSGGVQKEAYFFGVPCITLRPETEWVETVEAGWNVLSGGKKDLIENAVATFQTPVARPPLYGDGAAAPKIVQILLQTCTEH